MTQFKVGDDVRDVGQKSYTGTVVAVRGDEVEIEWRGLALGRLYRVHHVSWVEHIPLLSVADAERAVVRAAMAWFTTGDDDRDANTSALEEACRALRAAVGAALDRQVCER